jgi:glucosyl-3-phosphoglycerate synthase
LDDSFVEMVGQTYYQNALRFVKIYSDDAEVNDLAFDRYEEEMAARHFRGFLGEAWRELAQASGEPVLASWNRIFYSMSDIYDGLREAVESDNAR